MFGMQNGWQLHESWIRTGTAYSSVGLANDSYNIEKTDLIIVQTACAFNLHNVPLAFYMHIRIWRRFRFIQLRLIKVNCYSHVIAMSLAYDPIIEFAKHQY